MEEFNKLENIEISDNFLLRAPRIKKQENLIIKDYDNYRMRGNINYPIKQYNYNYKKITAICYDSNRGDFLWVAFEKEGGICKLLKVSASNPMQVYFELDFKVDKIYKIIEIDYYSELFILVEHESILAYRLYKMSPQGREEAVYRPSNVVDKVVDAIHSTGSVYGITSGETEDAKIISMRSAPVTISRLLPGVSNVNSFVKEESGLYGFWITTYTSPGMLYYSYTKLGQNYLIEVKLG